MADAKKMTDETTPTAAADAPKAENTAAKVEAAPKTEVKATPAPKTAAPKKAAAAPKATAKKTAQPKFSAKKVAQPKTEAKQNSAPKSETKETSAPNSSAASGLSAAQMPTDFAKMIVNQLVEAQRMWIEITTQQTALVFKTVTDVMGLSNTAPTEELANWAKQGVESFIQAQKQWSEIAMNQGEELMNTVQLGANFGGADALDTLGTVQNAAGKGLETVVNMRTASLYFAEQQNAQMTKMLKQNLNLDESSPVAALADFAQATMSSYVEIQKRWLDMATQIPFFGGSTKDKK